jgi:DNA-binding CsgD family transcriptional regulator
VREGLTAKEIARRRAVGVPTVRTYLRRIFDKLGIERRAALAGWSVPPAGR